MSKLLSTFALAIVLSACAGTAQGPADKNDEAVATSEAADETRIVCHNVKSTGFRTKNRVCRPANEW